MKKALVVLDFDKTLIPFDSFRKYIFIWQKKYKLAILFIIVLRKLRIISNYNLKKKLLNIIKYDYRLKTIDLKFASSLSENINNELLNYCKGIAGKDGELLILSASPDSYISLVGNIIQTNAKGSYFDSDGNFIHLYGSGKIEYVLNAYPADTFEYLYAVSDSLSDLEFLKLFREYRILNEGEYL